MADSTKRIEIVTGSTGEVHVTPIDDAVRNTNTGYVHDKVVFTYYENLLARSITANEVRVYSGYGMNQGRLFKIPRNQYQSVTIRNGSAGVKRADLIVARYTMDMTTGFEDIDLVVIEGQSGSEYVDPTYTTGDINAGATTDDFPLYRVKINGLVIDGDPEPLFELLPDGGRLGELEARLDTNIITDLASESRGNLNDCQNEENLDIGVKGILPISHGGTGQNTAYNAFNSLANGTSANTNNIADADTVISKTGNTWVQKTFSKVWTYIQAKISSVLGLTASQYGGNSATATTLSSTLTVNKGGTGNTSNTANAVLLGNGTSAIKNKASANGAFYATGANSEPAFGTLPVAQGGTGSTDAAGARSALGLGSVAIENIVPIAKGGTGATDAAGIRNALGLGNTTEALPVANGGTGKSSIGNGKFLVGNSSGGYDEKSIVSSLDGSSNVPTSKAVEDAMGSAGYGDMLKSTYDPNSDGIIAIAQGGTGANTAANARTALGLGSVATENTLPISKGGTGATSAASARNALGLGNTTGALPIANGGTGTTDGTINGVKLGKSGSQYGYYDGSTFKAFKDPTGTASAGDVLSGKTFANAASNTLVTGTMANNGAQTKSLNCGASYTIPAGYHNGSGKVTANSLASQTSANATAAQILKGKTAWVNGSKVTGTMTNRAAATERVSQGIDAGYVWTRIPQGAYITNQATGYPEIKSPLSDFGTAGTDNVMEGTTFTSTAGLNVEGTISKKASVTASVSNAVNSDGVLFVRIPKGAYTVISSDVGYPQITVPKANASFWLGVNEADARANPNSANWQNGRAQGHADRNVFAFGLHAYYNKDTNIISAWLQIGNTDVMTITTEGRRVDLGQNLYVSYNNGLQAN